MLYYMHKFVRRDEAMTPFTQDVINLIVHIPKGKVMSYGQIAALCGNPRGARQVARILHSMTASYDLPWHRVVNKEGKVALRDDKQHLQRGLLEEEGIIFNDKDGIDMERYRFHP